MESGPPRTMSKASTSLECMGEGPKMASKITACAMPGFARLREMIAHHRQRADEASLCDLPPMNDVDRARMVEVVFAEAREPGASPTTSPLSARSRSPVGSRISSPGPRHRVCARHAASWACLGLGWETARQPGRLGPRANKKLPARIDLPDTKMKRS
jgi:hypothetical protein